eukprot:365578-Chlamydomonas_euryale.AAC.2
MRFHARSSIQAARQHASRIPPARSSIAADSAATATLRFSVVKARAPSLFRLVHFHSPPSCPLPRSPLPAP